MYIGLAKVGPPDIGAEVFTFPFEVKQPITDKQKATGVVVPDPDGAYRAPSYNHGAVVGTLVALQECQGT